MDTELPHYPVVQFLVKHGNRFAVGLASLAVLSGFLLSWSIASWLYAVGGLIAGALLYIIAKSYVELVQIIADMLLPK